MLDAMNSRREETEKPISRLEKKVMKSNETEQKREVRIRQSKNKLRELSIPLNIIIFIL